MSHPPPTLGVVLHSAAGGSRLVRGGRFGAPSPGGQPGRDPGPVPIWMQFLRETAILAALRPVTPPRRLLVGLPTTDLAVATLVYGAVAALSTHRSTNPLRAPASDDVGQRVSAFFTGAYRDTYLEAAGPGSATVRGATTMTTYADTVRALPAGFLEDRGPRRLKSEAEVLDAWDGAKHAGVDPARLHARCSATPVVVIGSHSGLCADAAQLEAMWAKAKAFVDPGHGLEAWFRHPTLVCDPRSEVPPWLVGSTPALVVCDGAAAWRSQLRRAFPDTAHILVVDRRSPAGIDVVDEIYATNPQSEPFAPAPPLGIEAWRIAEAPVAMGTTGADEDLF